jgi:RNA exonuclease 1
LIDVPILTHISTGITPKPSPDEPTPVAPPPATEAEVQNALITLDKHLSTLYASLPSRTALVLFTGHSDPRGMAALQMRKNAFEQAVRLGVMPEDMAADIKWTAQDGRTLEEEVERAKRGLVFLCVK